MHTEISDTSRYVQNVSPLASNAAIQTYVADEVSTRLLAQVDVDAYVKDALPTRRAKARRPAPSAFEGFVHEAVLRVVQSKQFQTLWDEANRIAHTQLDNVLTGSHNSAIVRDPNGTVSIDLSAVVNQVVQRLQSTGIDLFSKIPIVKVGGQIPIFQSKDLYQIRKAVGLFNKIAYLLPFLVLACFGGAVWLSKNRRKGFLAAAICFGLGALDRWYRPDRRPALLSQRNELDLPEDAAAAVFDTLVRFFRVSVRAALLFSVIVIVAVFFSGPSKAATAFRRSVQRSANWLGTQTDEAGWGWLGSHAFFVKYKRPMRIIVTVVALRGAVPMEAPDPDGDLLDRRHRARAARPHRVLRAGTHGEANRSRSRRSTRSPTPLLAYCSVDSAFGSAFDASARTEIRYEHATMVTR